MNVRVALVNLGSFAALEDGLDEFVIGGEEVQHAVLARQLVRAGIDAHLVTGDFGQPDGPHRSGVVVHPAYRSTAGVPGLRFVYPRWVRLEAALRRADADLYYVSCAGALVGQVAWHARRRGRPFVFRVASDGDCDPARLLLGGPKQRWLYEYGLRRADAVLAQTEWQRTALAHHYRRSAELAPLLAEAPAEPPQPGLRDIDVLWVANLRALKRPQWAVELAFRLPDRQVHLVGGEVPGEARVAAEVRRLAQPRANLTLHGRLGYRKTLALFDRARVFVNTSTIEGFPNTFLQAWSRGVPAVATFDPDGLIRSHGLGAHVTDPAGLAREVQALLSQPGLWSAASLRCRRFFAQRFSPETQLAPYLRAFERVVRRGGR